MRVRVKFFATLKEVFGGGEREVELGEGANIKDLLDTLCDSSRCRQKVFDDSGEPRTRIQIMKNRLPIQSFDGINTRLEEGDVVSVIPPMFAG
ncbi:MAG: MoaD/ThiS family protein [Chloroflexi bacterium]|jgi:molybdopterin synthase sulfur carrier subunit|nr:MoaD/ThiS family protein [Chloroflexota bacterium]